MTNNEPQLHELLAVEQDLKGQANKILAETKSVFNREEMFRGSHTSYSPYDEADAHLAAEDHEELGTTVPKRLDYTAKTLARYYDAVLQKETTNQGARADIVIGGVAIASNVPATMLLGLETKLREFRGAIESMPALDVKVEWAPAPDQGPDVFAAVHANQRFRTKKITKPVVLYEATKEHPAQVKECEENIHVGVIEAKVFSGAVTSARKAEILGNLDTLIRAVKKARQRANKQVIVKGKIGAALFDFVLKT